MLVQLHWQNPLQPTETLLVMQSEINSDEEGEELVKLCRETIEARKDECPEGWIPMVCDENYEGFAWKLRF